MKNLFVRFFIRFFVVIRLRMTDKNRYVLLFFFCNLCYAGTPSFGAWTMSQNKKILTTCYATWYKSSPTASDRYALLKK